MSAPTDGPSGERLVVTIDGPAASGKSSVARLLAARLGVAYVSSGLLYRAAALLALKEGVEVDDEAALVTLLESRDVRIHPTPEENRVTVDWVDVTNELHTASVDASVSAVARHARVRGWVNDRLREMGGSFVIDGRDMGSSVFPRAAVKFYLTAAPEVRAARRAGERGADVGYTATELSRRDENDRQQSAPAPDAIVVDTGPLSLPEVVERVLSGVLRALPDKAIST